MLSPRRSTPGFSPTPASFRTATRRRDFRSPACWSASGINPARIAQSVYESVAFESLKVLGETLADLCRRTPDGRISWIRLPFAVLGKLASPAESEEWASYPRSLETSVISVWLKEEASPA